jgi:hypothetical protein
LCAHLSDLRTQLEPYLRIDIALGSPIMRNSARERRRRSRRDAPWDLTAEAPRALLDCFASLLPSALPLSFLGRRAESVGRVRDFVLDAVARDLPDTGFA